MRIHSFFLSVISLDEVLSTQLDILAELLVLIMNAAICSLRIPMDIYPEKVDKGQFVRNVALFYLKLQITSSIFYYSNNNWTLSVTPKIQTSRKAEFTWTDVKSVIHTMKTEDLHSAFNTLELCIQQCGQRIVTYLMTNAKNKVVPSEDEDVELTLHLIQLLTTYFDEKTEWLIILADVSFSLIFSLIGFQDVCHCCWAHPEPDEAWGP